MDTAWLGETNHMLEQVHWNSTEDSTDAATYPLVQGDGANRQIRR